MNDKSQRIYNLAKEAGLIEFETLSWNPDVQSPNPESVVKARKFAELIIQECADIARDVGTDTEPTDFALDKCYEIESKIKNHFGIE